MLTKFQMCDIIASQQIQTRNFGRYKMNRSYNINESKKSNCTYIGSIDRFETENDNIADSFIALLCTLFSFIRSEGFRTALRVVATVICFIGFVGIIGSVESGAMTLGRGILFSVFMIFVEILCFIPAKAEK